MLNLQVIKQRSIMGLNFFRSAPEAHEVQSEEYVMDQDMQAYPEAELASHTVDLPYDGGSGSVYSTIAKWIMLVGAFLMPLFFLPWTTNVLEMNKQLLLVTISGSALVFWLLDVVISGKMSLRMNSLDKGVAGMLVATAVATIFSLSRFKSLFGLNLNLSESLVSVLAGVLFYFLAVNLFDDRGRALKRMLGFSISIALFYGLLQMFTLYVLRFSFSMSRAFNTVGSLNALGLLAALSLPFFMKTKLTVWRFVDVGKIGMIMSVLILIILNWWVLWVVAIAGMLALIAFQSLTVANEGKFKITRFLFPMTVIVLSVFLIIVKFNLNVVKKNFPIEVAPSYSLSMEVSKNALKESLIFGYGPQNFSLAFDKFGASKLANTNLANAKFFDATSHFFNGIINGGIVFMLAFAFLLWVIGWTLFKMSSAIESESAEDKSEITSIASMVVAFVVAYFLYPFNLTIAFLMYASLALLALGIWGGRKRVYNIEERPVFSLISSLGFIGGLILVLAGAYFLAAQYLSDVTYASALSQSNIDTATSKLVDAINWDNKDDRYYRTASQVAIQMLANEVNKKADPKDTGRTQRVQNDISSAIELAKQAVAVEPKEASNWYNLGEIYQSLLVYVDGVDKLAEEAFLKAAELRPGDPSPYTRIGQMFLDKSELSRRLAQSSSGENAARFNRDSADAIKKSEAAFIKATTLSPNYGLAIYNLGVVYEREGKLVESIKQLEKIAPYNANQPGLMFELGLLYYRNNQKDNALAAVERAVLLSPDFANARWYLGLIYEERKNFPAAITQMENILKNNPGNEVVTKKLEDLKKGVSAVPPKDVLDTKPL